MAYKSIVTFVQNHKTDMDCVLAAASIAEKNDAHLTIVCLGIDHTNPGAYYGGANAMALQQTLADAEAEGKENEKAVRSAMGVWSISWEVITITAQIGALAPVIGERAQLADLVVLPKPYGKDRSVEDVVIVESALFRTRTPVMILPDGVTTAPEASSVIIAWNESTESLAAIRAAMPLLKEAKSVDVAIIDPPAHAADRSDPGGALAEMLSRHGIRGDISVLAKTMPRISDILCRHCQDKNADLVVMGAYGHSRFREAILGGATRNMLEMTEVPMLIAH
ncbi:MAG: universal stress protein [Rhodobacteraceae bacterium]|nr:universal stress protein [Alphaproteobacteria bacterium]MBT8474895.1 universal stress protein [Alphaproteobacteria bacterium]NNK67181.1 universal stress protein [Paracoccaceae bacterium]